jgi:VWFA-related protein
VLMSNPGSTLGRCTLGVLFCLGAVLSASAQTALSPSPAGTDPRGANPYTITVQSRQTLVDVIVTDKKGNPVKGLKESDFHVTESGQAERINYFKEHTAEAVPARPPAPLPAGVYTNIPLAPPTDTLNVLLIDGLNTSFNDQPYVKSQMLKYLKEMPASARVAVFALGTQLHYIQGFTSDPKLLIDALKNKSHTYLGASNANAESDIQGATEADDPARAAEEGEELTADDALGGLADFDQELTTARAVARNEITVEAFEEIAAYLSNFPGRKNLMWFAGGFPQIMGNEYTPDMGPDLLAAGGAGHLREMTNMFKQANIAIYPIDAGGLAPPSAFSVSKDSKLSIGASNASDFRADATRHDTMNQIALDTGGRAIYNTNDLSDAVKKVINENAFYYTVGYVPPRGAADGKFRRIKVSLPTAQKGMTLYYRTGYFSSTPDAPKVDAATVVSANVAQRNPFFQTMRRGAPDATGILFKLKVEAVGTVDQTGKEPLAGDDTGRLKGPLVRYRLDWALDLHSILTTVGDDGDRSATLRVAAAAFDADGNPINSQTRQLDLNFTPAQFAEERSHGLQFSQMIDLPKGEAFLRAGVYDPNGNKVGATEVPLLVRVPVPSAPTPAAKAAPAVPPTPE